MDYVIITGLVIVVIGLVWYYVEKQEVKYIAPRPRPPKRDEIKSKKDTYIEQLKTVLRSSISEDDKQKFLLNFRNNVDVRFYLSNDIDFYKKVEDIISKYLK